MRATEVTQSRSIHTDAVLVLNRINQLFETLEPGAMTTYVPCPVATEVHDTLSTFKLLHTDLTMLESEHLRRMLVTQLSSLSSTWLVSECDHADHDMETSFDQLVEMWMIPGVNESTQDVADSLLRQLISTKELSLSSRVMLESTLFNGRLGSIVGNTEGLEVTLTDQLYALSREGNTYIGVMTLTGNEEARARLDRDTLVITGLHFKVQTSDNGVIVDVALRNSSDGPRLTIDATTVRTPQLIH